jgi:hypothetical protein
MACQISDVHCIQLQCSYSLRRSCIVSVCQNILMCSSYPFPLPTMLFYYGALNPQDSPWLSCRTLINLSVFFCAVAVAVSAESKPQDMKNFCFHVCEHLRTQGESAGGTVNPSARFSSHRSVTTFAPAGTAAWIAVSPSAAMHSVLYFAIVTCTGYIRHSSCAVCWPAKGDLS